MLSDYDDTSCKSIYITYAGGTLELSRAKLLRHAFLHYRLPGIVRKNNPEFKPKVYLEKSDVVELDILREDEKKALLQADFLVVVCSKAAKASNRITEQIALFQKGGKQNHILTLLVEGNPQESFPENLWGNTVYHYTDQNGLTKENIKSFEPLAADIRASGFFTALIKMREEKLRLIAQILCCSFDELKQRYRLRQRRVYMLIGCAILTVSFTFSMLLLMQGREILKRRELVQTRTATVHEQLHFYYVHFPSHFDDNPIAAKLIQDNICKSLRSLQIDLIRGQPGANFLVSLPLDEVLQIHPEDSLENAMIKASVCRMQGNMQKYEKILLKMPELFNGEFTGDINAYVNHALLFTQQYSKQYGGIYISKIAEDSNWRQYDFQEGDILIGYIRKKKARDLVFKDNFTSMLTIWDESNEIVLLRLNEEGKYIKHRIKVENLHEQDRINTGLSLYEI